MMSATTQRSDADQNPSTGMNYVVWTVQGLLALVFLFSGGVKLLVPIEQLLKQMPIPLPGAFIRFIGLCEALGGLGLILPGLLRIRRSLTPLAGCGLVIIMTGATVYNLRSGSPGTAVLTVVLGLLAAFVAHRRWSSLKAA
jgi:uncharacterized membrane protein YphA (DoxX/SURF4 family)